MKFERLPSIWLGTCGVVYVAGVFLCLTLADKGFTIGFVAGGGLVLLNSLASAQKIIGAEFSNRSAVTASVVGGFYLRLAVFGICVYLLIRFFDVDPVGLVAGITVVPAGLLAMLVMIYIANRRPEEV
jgi:hypothetical protein